MNKKEKKIQAALGTLFTPAERGVLVNAITLTLLHMLPGHKGNPVMTRIVEGKPPFVSKDTREHWCLSEDQAQTILTKHKVLIATVGTRLPDVIEHMMIQRYEP